MSDFMNAVQAFIDQVRGEKGWIDELNAHARGIGAHLSGVSPDECNEALRRFAGLFPDIPLVALGLVAINCGSLVERGGDPDIVGPGLLERLPVIIETASDFFNRCRALAIADAQLIEQLRETEKDKDEEDEPLTPAKIVERHVANAGWKTLANRFGKAIYEDQPGSVVGFMSEELFRLGLIAHLSRSKKLRAAARERPELLKGTLSLDAAQDAHRSFLSTMLQVLDDELLLVLHVEQRKGFDVRISGIADNFQLHTLLAGAIIGRPEQGFVTGLAPSAQAVAACRDAAIDQLGGDEVTGAFNLYNWNALKQDGSLEASHGKGATSHWIWNEGWPSDILRFEGRRIVLLGAPSYPRQWGAGRQFFGMIGQLSVERRLDRADVDGWLHRLTQAARGAH